MSPPTSSAIVFSYGDGDGVRRLLPVLLASGADRVGVVTEGDEDLAGSLESLGGPRLRVFHGAERLGKARAYNQVVPWAQETEVTFLISADVGFPCTTLRRMLEEFADPRVGVVVPRVLPQPAETAAERVGAVLWHLHDLQLSTRVGGREDIHGGEVVALRRSLVVPLPENVVNDDAYLCLRAVQQGLCVRYCRDAVVRNVTPSTLRGLCVQRRRVNFGHRQLNGMGMRPRILTTMMPDEAQTVLSVMGRFARSHPGELPYLAILLGLETYSQALAWGDARRRKDHSRWAMVPRRTPAPMVRPHAPHS